jgi:hypothetical protein
MHFLSITFAFLIIFTIFAVAQFNKLTDYVMMRSTYTQCFEKNCETIAKSLQTRAYALKCRQLGTIEGADDGATDEKPKKGKEKPSDAFRTRQLHIGALLPTKNKRKGKDAAKNDELDKESQELLKKLLQSIYGNKKFYQEASSQVENFEESFIKHLFDPEGNLVKEGLIRTPEDLANLEFDTTKMQSAFYKILKGNLPAANNQAVRDTESYPSLIDFISFKNRRTYASVYLAPREILNTLFKQDEGNIVENILQERNAIHTRVNKPNNPEDIDSESTKFREAFEKHLNDSIPKDKIDFRVSKTQP